jgi:hypothetical protein
MYLYCMTPKVVTSAIYETLFAISLTFAMDTTEPSPLVARVEENTY